MSLPRILCWYWNVGLEVEASCRTVDVLFNSAGEIDMGWVAVVHVGGMSWACAFMTKLITMTCTLLWMQSGRYSGIIQGTTEVLVGVRLVVVSVIKSLEGLTT